DYRVTQKGPEESLKIIQQELGLLFSEALSEYLSPAHKILIGITDIDLPGELNSYARVAGKNLRATGDFRKVRLNFKIVVKDELGKVILADAFELRDNSKRPKIRKTFSDWKATDLFRRPIKRWAAETFTKD
ncbi:MAG: DUF3016 domain-containing protein, partial [Kangiellaceae bacterium]|nr:DUF3016 domain-containing protein [Kangiellaceae bacterium]